MFREDFWLTIVNLPAKGKTQDHEGFIQRRLKDHNELKI